MEMRRYIRHSNGWWWLAAVCMAIAVCCAVKAAQVQKDREAMAPAPLLVGEERAGDYRHIDAVYMTDWVYRVTDRSGRKKIFYFAGDADGYVYLVRLGDGQYAAFAAMPDELPVRLAGVLCTVPKAYLPDLAEVDGSTVEEYVDYYGDYYIDAAMTPADLNNGFRTGAVSAFAVGVILLLQSAVFSVQFRKELRRLEERGLLERAEYAFQNARGDLYGNVRLSDTFIYGRHAALARPLTDVLWVYWHEKTGAVDVHLLTADGRDCMLRLSGQTARRNAEEILQAVAARNSGVLVGRTRENGLRYNRQVPRIRQQRVRRIVLWAVWLAAAAAAFAVLALT